MIQAAKLLARVLLYKAGQKLGWHEYLTVPTDLPSSYQVTIPKDRWMSINVMTQGWVRIEVGPNSDGSMLFRVIGKPEGLPAFFDAEGGD